MALPSLSLQWTLALAISLALQVSSSIAISMKHSGECDRLQVRKEWAPDQQVSKVREPFIA
ncbi:hypothetical protein CC2G_004828 [Coprinopsis cinerea AmutBmut pab1-1]|nr:hypothetical protein CC2G_004828 [Coprinopsis cinerea AmutBmut pab1-1]